MVVRYEIPWIELTGTGGLKETITRRDYNERFGQEGLTPDIDVPVDGEHIWEWFWHLSDRRQNGMSGPQPLSYRDLEAWMTITGTLVLREESEILLNMDNAYCSAIATEQEIQRKSIK